MISYRPPVFPNVSDNKKNGTQVSLPHQRGTRTAVCCQYGTKSKTKIARVRQISQITPKLFCNNRTSQPSSLHNKSDGTPHKNHPHRRKFYITQCVINFFPQFPQFLSSLKSTLLCSDENKRRNANLDSRGMRSAIYVLIVCFEKSSKGERMPHASISHTHCFSSPASSIIARGL